MRQFKKARTERKKADQLIEELIRQARERILIDAEEEDEVSS